MDFGTHKFQSTHIFFSMQFKKKSSNLWSFTGGQDTWANHEGEDGGSKDFKGFSVKLATWPLHRESGFCSSDQVAPATNHNKSRRDLEKNLEFGISSPGKICNLEEKMGKVVQNGMLWFVAGLASCFFAFLC